jgi:dihydroxyacetone kinase phosphotransfer subunit
VVGIVIVSHSYRLAEGVKELVDSLTGGRVPIVAAGGLDENTLGTTTDRILNAIQHAWRGAGVLVLVDLGSSVLNTTLALELLPENISKGVVLSPGPLVEAAISAALQADEGASFHQVIDVASQAASFPKGVEKTPHLSDVLQPQSAVKVEGVFQLPNPLGMHARPAAMIVEAARKYGNAIYLSKIGSNQPPARADSLLNLLMLNARQGDQLLLSVEGNNAQIAFHHIRDLILSGFHELDKTSSPTQ